MDGPIVLIQWARDDGEINLHSVFNSPIEETIEIFEMLCDEPDGVCGFNLAFDWFHVSQSYTSLMLLGEKVLPKVFRSFVQDAKSSRSQSHPAQT